MTNAKRVIPRKTYCADCGAVIEQGRDTTDGQPRWAERLHRADDGFPPAWSYTCRMVREGTKVLRADYHYVEGEVQRHFTPRR